MSQTAHIHMTFEPTSKGSIVIKMLIWDITIIARYQYYCPTLALRLCRMCEANWNHVAFLVVLQTTISMELEFNLSQYSISSQCLHIHHEKSALENISAMPQLFSPVANFPQQYSPNWYSPSCVGRIKPTLPKLL